METKVASADAALYAGYAEKRYGAAYYYYVAAFVAAFGKEAKSIIDVGSNRIPLVENFDWIPDRYSLDILSPVQSDKVTAIKADFFTYTVEKKFDLAMCLQVLEHIDDAERFAQKLFAIGNHVIISVPYKWPKGHTKSHVQDPVDEEKLRSWTHRDPSHLLLVPEPLIRGEVAYRMLAYYHPNPEKFELSRARARTLAVPEPLRPQLTVKTP